MSTTQTWRAHYGDLAPVGHLLRAAIPRRWLRIHSLPGSQRYATNPAEYAALLERHNAVASEILGRDGDAILYLQHFGSRDELVPTFAPFTWTGRAALHDAVLTTVEPTDDADLGAVIAACRVRWSARAWDELIRDVADANLASVVLFNPASGEAYAPYDGGADIFVATARRAADLRRTWSPWLSSRADGL